MLGTLGAQSAAAKLLNPLLVVVSLTFHYPGQGLNGWGHCRGLVTSSVDKLWHTGGKKKQTNKHRRKEEQKQEYGPL